MADERLSRYKQDAEVDKRVQERLDSAGFRKPEDLGSGRADVGLTAQMLGDTDPQIAPLLAEKEMRDAQWAQQAGGAEQPEPESESEPDKSAPEPPADAPKDRLSQLQQQLDQAVQEAREWKKRAGDDRNRVGEIRKRLQELEARSNSGGQQFQPQPQWQQPGIAQLSQMPQDEQLTPQGVMQLMLAQSAAFGQQLAAAKEWARQQAIDAARNFQGYTLTPADEADLQEQHPWLLDLQPGQREKAMMELSGKDKTTQSDRARTAPRTDVEQARGQARTFQYIEPSSQGSPVETSAAEGHDSILAQKAAKVRELLKTPGKLAEAEELMNELTPGGKRD